MNWFDLVIFCIFIFSFIKGYRTGFVMQLAALVGFLASAIFAGQLATLLAPKLIDVTHFSVHVIKPLSYLVAFILILVAFLFAGRVLHSFLTIVKLSLLNKLSGALFSLLKWVVILSIIINIVSEFDQGQRLINENTRNTSYFYSRLKSVMPRFVPFLHF